MYSINFKNMFSSTSTNLISDKEAAKQNLKLVVGSSKQSLFGDPHFGCNIDRYLFMQNEDVLATLISEEIYEAIQTYVPQIIVQRKDINVIIDKTIMYVLIDYKYVSDAQLDTFQIELSM